MHIKTDILKLQFCIHLWKKDTHKPGSVYSSFRMRHVQSLEKSVCRSKCDQKHNQGFAKREKLKPKVNVFAQKLSNLSPVLTKPLQLKRVTKGAEPPAAG